MGEGSQLFSGAVPRLYDQLLGPIFFQPYAQRLAERLGDEDRTILESAAGTGIVTRAMAAARPASRITATDLNQAMLDVAAATAPPANVVWRQADAQALPFPDQAFDLVVCSFGVMFMPDKHATFVEARRVLRPGGRFLLTVWDRIGANLIKETADTAVAALFPDDPPCFFARGPCGYHDRARIERDLREAGFGRVTVEEVPSMAEVASTLEAAQGCCQGTPMRGLIEARDPTALPRATEAVAHALRARFGDGPFHAAQQALLMTASQVAAQT